MTEQNNELDVDLIFNHPVVDEDNQISEHYINQLKDSISWLEFARGVEGNVVKRSKLTEELEQARDQLERVYTLNG